MEKRFVTMERLRSAAESGTVKDRIAYADWMQFHCPDRINEENAKLIRMYYLEGIRKRNVRAMLGMAQLYEEGLAGHENIPAARRLYRRAYREAEDEFEKQMALTLLARLYYESDKPDDWEEARALVCENTTELLYAPYAILLGDMQKDGKCMTKRYHAAYESYLVARAEIFSTEESRRCLPDVLIRYGEIYGFGLYVPKDPLKAEGYFSEAEDLLGNRRRDRMRRERICRDRLLLN